MKYHPFNLNPAFIILLGVTCISSQTFAGDRYKEIHVALVHQVSSLGYKKIERLNLNQVKDDILSIPFIRDEKVNTITISGERESGRYDADTLDLPTSVGHVRRVRVPFDRLSVLYTPALIHSFLIHETLGVLEYSDKNYELSAFLGALSLATADQRIELFNTGFIEPFKKPHQRYTGNLYFKSLAEGGSHVGGGGELFPYEVKMMSYLNSLDRLKNLPQAYRANIEDKLILLPIEMVKDFNSGIGQPTKLNWVRLNAETGTIQIDRSVVESIQTSIAARTELANTTSNFVLEILLQPSI